MPKDARTSADAPRPADRALGAHGVKIADPNATQVASLRALLKTKAAIPDADPDTQREVIDAFRAAARQGDFEALLEALDPEVVVRADCGAVSIGASRVVRGAANVARQAVAFSRLDVEVRPALVNGAAGTVSLRGGRPFAIAGYTIRNRRIVETDVLTDPERLSQLELTILE